MLDLSEKYFKRLESFLRDSEKVLEYNHKGTTPPNELMNRFRASRGLLSLGLSNAIAKHKQKKPIKGRFYLLSDKLVFIKKITAKSVEFKRVRDDGSLTPGNFHLSHKETDSLNPVYWDDGHYLFVDDDNMVLLKESNGENLARGDLKSVKIMWKERYINE